MFPFQMLYRLSSTWRWLRCHLNNRSLYPRVFSIRDCFPLFFFTHNLFKILVKLRGSLREDHEWNGRRHKCAVGRRTSSVTRDANFLMDLAINHVEARSDQKLSMLLSHGEHRQSDTIDQRNQLKPWTTSRWPSSCGRGFEQVKFWQKKTTFIQDILAPRGHQPVRNINWVYLKLNLKNGRKKKNSPMVTLLNFWSF